MTGGMGRVCFVEVVWTFFFLHEQLKGKKEEKKIPLTSAPAKANRSDRMQYRGFVKRVHDNKKGRQTEHQ